MLSIIRFWSTVIYENKGYYPQINLRPSQKQETRLAAYLGSMLGKKWRILISVAVVILLIVSINPVLPTIQQFRSNSWIKAVEVSGIVQYQSGDIASSHRLQKDDVLEIGEIPVFFITDVSGSTRLLLYDGTLVELLNNSVIKVTLDVNVDSETDEPLITILNGTALITSESIRVKDMNFNTELLVENQTIRVTSHPKVFDYQVIQGEIEGVGGLPGGGQMAPPTPTEESTP